MNPIDQLKSVLCDHEGKCCISGSDEDRAIIDRALRAPAEPAVEPSTDDSSVLSACQKLAQAFKTSPPPPAEPARTSQDVCTVPLLSDAELEVIEVREKPANGPQSTLNFARAIEQAVRRKVGL